MFQSSDAEMKSYFSSLPHFIQESIQQSSVEIHTLEDLKSIACHLQAEAGQKNP